MTLRLLSILVAAALAAPGQARQPEPGSPAAHEALAQDIAGFMAVTRWNWSLRWDAFGTRSRNTRWHLAPPHPWSTHDLEHGVTRRTGWIASGGRQIVVAVCGDDQRVLKLAAHVDGGYGGEGMPDLIAAFAHTEARTSPLAARDETRFWRLDRPERDPATLALTVVCTPEGSAAARRCWTVAEVFFRPDYDPESPAAALPAERCRLPGRN